MGGSGSAYIVDQMGLVVAHRNPSVVLRGTEFSVPEQDGIHTGLDGSKVVLASEKIRFGDQSLFVVTERPVSEALALTIRSVLTIAGVLIVALAFASALVFLAVRQIVHPIQTLATTAKAITNGDLSPQIDVRGTDEVGQLADSFRLMVNWLTSTFGELEHTVTKLRGRETELKTLNESLEARVGERTQELSQANQGLEVEVTERKQAEYALERKAEELTRSNMELEQFANAASHDLQEPLRKIQAFGDLLASKSGESLNDDGRDYLDRMRAAASRMESLINGLLTFSRVTTQAQPYASVDLQDITTGVLSDLEVRISDSGGRVEVGALPTIEAEPLQMRQLLQKLIGNALKFQRPGEPPVVTVESRSLTSNNGTGAPPLSKGELRELTVQDNGIGFDEKYADKVFGIFQRLHGRSAYEGTGIGLATCRKIVERHGGSIEAKSAPGEGATFVVTMPVKRPKGEDDPWTR